jgi:hypothetical protein
MELALYRSRLRANEWLEHLKLFKLEIQEIPIVVQLSSMRSLAAENGLVVDL